MIMIFDVGLGGRPHNLVGCSGLAVHRVFRAIGFVFFTYGEILYFGWSGSSYGHCADIEDWRACCRRIYYLFFWGDVDGRGSEQVVRANAWQFVRWRLQQKLFYIAGKMTYQKRKKHAGGGLSRICFPRYPSPFM